MPGGPVDQVKARLDVVDVVSERVVLKKSGKSLKGLCPFHVEKTPSFMVFPETGTWHCFGCGAGGDIFTFVMQSRNVEFAEALSLLATRAGVELRAAQQESRSSEGTDALHAANEAAAAYFRSMLSGPAGARARAYLRQREISEESVEAFQIGFAPDTGAGLAHHLLQQGIGRAVVLQAGLAGENESGGLYDRFRSRLIFPIRDAAGKLVGFGGRGLSSDVVPKYLNTPQTPIFDKGGCLYAIDRSRPEIRRTGQAVIVEGYIDALMAHQHGFRNVVASLGTAVTERQVSQLKRMASELCFALDPDTAGQEATARGLAVAMDALERTPTPIPSWKGFVDYVYKLKTTIKIIALPRGSDPDDVIRRNSSDWQRLVQEAVPVQDFFLHRVAGKHDLTTAVGKAAAVEEAMAVIAEIPEAVQQAHYVQKLASLVGLEEAILLQQVRRRRGRPAAAGASTRDRDPRPGADVEGYCLALLLHDPSLLDREPRLRDEHFANPAYREIFRRMAGLRREGKGEADAPTLVEELRGELQGPLVASLEQVVELQARQPAPLEDRLEKAYRSAAISVIRGSLALRRREVESLVAEARAGSDPAEVAALSRIEKEIAEESYRLMLLGGTLPLRTVHKEVRHGG